MVSVTRKRKRIEEDKENEENEKPMWQYYDGSLTAETKAFIMQTVRQSIESVQLTDGERYLTIRINLDSLHGYTAPACSHQENNGNTY
jgi:hypothetical protein